MLCTPHRQASSHTVDFTLSHWEEGILLELFDGGERGLLLCQG